MRAISATGSPRVLRELRAKGFAVSKRRVERAMRSMGLTPPTPRTITTVPIAAPLLLRTSLRSRLHGHPSERALGHRHHVRLDRRRLGVPRGHPRPLLARRRRLGARCDALTRACRSRRSNRRCPPPPESGLLHHSDRGCQYTSFDYRARLAELGVTVSMSRKGNCWDNAVAESFFATLKKELIHRRTGTRALELRTALFEYIEVFYNRRRLTHPSTTRPLPTSKRTSLGRPNACQRDRGNSRDSRARASARSRSRYGAAVPRVLRVSATSPEPAVIAEAALVLARAVSSRSRPRRSTGSARAGLHAAEVARIFAAKGRPPGIRSSFTSTARRWRGRSRRRGPERRRVSRPSSGPAAHARRPARVVTCRPR